MQNNTSKINTFLLVVLVILAGILVFRPYFKHENVAYTPTTMPVVNQITKEQEDQYAAQIQAQYQNNIQIQQQMQNNTWKYTTQPGLVVAYKSNWTAVPQSYGSPAMQAQGQSNIVGYMFTLPSGNTIMWGGNQSACNNTEFGAFVHGTSTVSCVKGIRADIGVSNVRNTLPQSDKNEFGDFVLKNQ